MDAMNQRLLAVLFLFGTAAFEIGCYDVFTDPLLLKQTGYDGTSGVGGTGGTGGTGGSSPGCIPGAENLDIDESCGVFVSSSLGGGGSGGKGSKGNPFATIGDALAEAPGKAIYACGEILTEVVKIESGDVTLYGALDCSKGWAYDPTKKTALTAEADQAPLTVGKGVGASVFDFEVEAVSAVAEGGSSIAVIADQGADLTMERCDLVTGDGKDGTAGEQPAGSGTPGPAGKDGQSGCVDLVNKTGGDAGDNTCGLTSQNGGIGGTGTKSDGGSGSDGQPVAATGKGGAPQTAAGATCTPGDIGANGTPGDPGEGASGIGAISGSGYQGEIGAEGKPNSTPGQGGGGGGGAKVCQTMSYAGPGGGGGGAGGCGGIPGKGGKPGGSSIGVLINGANVALIHVSITTLGGGGGGKGGDGQLGGTGGKGGLAGDENSDLAASACGGGKGGKGGDGGPGGGGLGGHSLGIAFKGTAPKQNDVQFTIGKAGLGGAAGNASMLAVAQGASGLTCKSLNFEDGAPSCSN